MLLRIGQADAYALAYEYVKSQDAPTLRDELLKFERYHQHPTYHKMKAGTYSDDCQMSIAVSEALLYNKTGDWDDDLEADTFLARFCIAFKRDPRDGYSRNLQAILEKARDPAHLKELIVPNSTKNGAAMRSVPLGVISDVEKMKAVAMRQARVTHDTYEGVLSSILVALMSHFALHDGREFSDRITIANYRSLP